MPQVSAAEALSYLRGPAIPIYSIDEAAPCYYVDDVDATGYPTYRAWTNTAYTFEVTSTTTTANTATYRHEWTVVPYETNQTFWRLQSNVTQTQTMRTWTAWNDKHHSRAEMLEIRRRQRVNDALRLADRAYQANADVLSQLTDEEMADYRRRFEAAEEQQRLRAERRLLANCRAEQLLLSLLNEQQRSQWTREIAVSVIGASGVSYLLEGDKFVGNVGVLNDSGVVQARLCVHISEVLPYADNVIAQMLAIRTDEAMFIGRANVHSGELPHALREIASTWRREQLERAAA